MMDYLNIYNAIISILSAVITGGFVLIFVEIGNRRNRENDRYRMLMSPFLRKLSAYFKYINWLWPHITHPKDETEAEKSFKNFLHYEIGVYGSQLIVGGGCYDVDSFEAKQLEEINEKINHVWYMYDRWDVRRLQLDTTINQEYVDKELKILNERYLAIPESLSKIAKVSSDFYTDEYMPLQDEPYYHELINKLYQKQCLFVCISLFIVLFMLCCLICIEMPLILMRIATILIVFLFATCMSLLFVNESKQLRIMSNINKNFKQLLNIDMKSQIKKMLEPLGLILLIGAFIWQNYSYYHANVARNEQLYRIEEATFCLLGCACDEAMKDSSRYKGNTTIYENYDAVLSLQNECYAAREHRREEVDKAANSWVVQCILYIIGSALIVVGKWQEKQREQEKGDPA